MYIRLVGVLFKFGIRHTCVLMCLCLLIFASVLVAFLALPGRAIASYAQARTTNPYTTPYGPPNCTWYAWQRLHDMEHFDLQFAANADDWIDQVQQPRAVWSETSQSYVQPQITLTPMAGDLVVLPYRAPLWADPYHVAFVEEGLDSSGRFSVSQQSYGSYGPGPNTSPYPYVSHASWDLKAMQRAEQGHALFIHFPNIQATTTDTPVQNTPTPVTTPTPLPTPTPVNTPTPLPSPTLVNTPTPHWSSILQQSAPACNNPGGTVWKAPSQQSTGLSCTGSGSVMQELSVNYAEEDLTSVNGNGYNPNQFRAQFQVTFLNPGDTNTWAALVLQTPQSGCGGLIFALNASGNWKLQNVSTNCLSLPVVGSGTININPGMATTVMLQLQNNVLLAFINGQQVLSYNDGLTPAQAVVGLMVMKSSWPSSSIQYSNFELDMWM